MALSRLASQRLSTWSTPMTLALLGIVSCGNLSSLWIQLASPELFLNTMPGVVPTSVMTSIGLVTFCFYEILIIVRKTPDTAFILDDILLHLALFPGGLSLLGHILNVQTYMGSNLDPRVGIGYMEMVFMGAYATAAARCATSISAGLGWATPGWRHSAARSSTIRTRCASFALTGAG